ncbi:MAG: thioredoxin family protein [Verrucomicrobia bacterium]|nr:thioredoxin family protein [Verrucomicrobiota bacterium]
MKKSILKKLTTTALLIIAVVTVVEFQKFMKRRAEACVGGVCTLPAENAGAIVGPQNVPMFLSPSGAEEQPLPELIDFGAGKCANCKMMNIVLEELGAEYAGRLSIRFVDVWEDEEKGKAYSIRMIPTQVFLDAEGNELFRHEGFMPKTDILKKWAELGVEL